MEVFEQYVLKALKRKLYILLSIQKDKSWGKKKQTNKTKKKCKTISKQGRVSRNWCQNSKCVNVFCKVIILMGFSIREQQ